MPLTPEMTRELMRTKPDFVLFVPNSLDGKTGSSGDMGNEQIMVFESEQKAPNTLLAVWTQSTVEGQEDQHICFARSTDEGRHWSEPRIIAGSGPEHRKRMASWAFPLVSRSGRIYVLY